jgi:hypothetical protein
MQSRFPPVDVPPQAHARPSQGPDLAGGRRGPVGRALRAIGRGGPSAGRASQAQAGAWPGGLDGAAPRPWPRLVEAPIGPPGTARTNGSGPRADLSGFSRQNGTSGSYPPKLLGGPNSDKLPATVRARMSVLEAPAAPTFGRNRRDRVAGSAGRCETRSPARIF